MSGIKRKIEDNDPDYEDISHIQESKRNKVVEHNGKVLLWSEHQHHTTGNMLMGPSHTIDSGWSML